MGPVQILPLVTLLFLSLSSCSGGGSNSSPASTGTPPSSGGGSAGPTITALALPSSPGFAAIRNGELIWGDRDRDVNLKKVSLAGGAISPLAIHFSVPLKVLLRGQDVYWSDGGLVGRLLQDNSVEILAEGSNCPNAGDYGSDFSVDDTYVYRLAAGPLGSSDACAIARIALSDGTETTLIDNPSGPIFGLTQDATHIYWTELSRSNSGTTTLSVKRIVKSGGTAQTLASGFTRFKGGPIVKDGNVYFVDTTGSLDSSRILKVPVTGGATVTLVGPIASTATNAGAPHAIDADLNNVYWVDDQTAKSVPVNGGPITTLATGLTQGITIAVNSTHVFWIEQLCCNGERPSRISRAPIGGGPASLVTDGIFGARTLSVDSSTVFWGEGMFLSNSLGRIAKQPISGGPSTTALAGVFSRDPPRFSVSDNGTIFVIDGEAIKKVSNQGGPQVEILFWRLGSYPGIPATDGSFLYFVLSSSYQLLKVPVNGGSETILAAAPGSMSGPVTTGNGFVYWIDQRGPLDLYAIKRTPSAGGPTETIVTGMTGTPSELITDSTYLYWADEYRSTIYKVALPGGTITTLWPGSFFDSGPKLAQDDTYIYFSNATQVGKVPKAGGQASFYEQLPDARFAIGIDSTSVYWATDVALMKVTPK